MNTPTIVTVSQLRDHLKLDSMLLGSPAPEALDDADLTLKLETATELICHYIADRHPADDDWVFEIEGWNLGSPQAPKVIQLAVLIQASEFYRFRGDDEKPTPPSERGYLLPAVENLVSRYKNRAFA